jgi:hypothetical protein
VNLEVEKVTPVIPRPDARDWLTVALIGGGFIASWVYVFVHPSVEAFGIVVGGVGTFGAIFHGLSVHDDKQPDRKES